MNTLKAHYNANKNKLSPSGERAMMKEIKRQSAEYFRKHELEIVAQILWELHEQPDTKFGAKKLRRFYDRFEPILANMIDYYELDDSDRGWICIHKLKDIGVDLEAWQEECEKDDE